MSSYISEEVRAYASLVREKSSNAIAYTVSLTSDATVYAASMSSSAIEVASNVGSAAVDVASNAGSAAVNLASSAGSATAVAATSVSRAAVSMTSGIFFDGETEVRLLQKRTFVDFHHGVAKSRIALFDDASWEYFDFGPKDQV